MESLLSRRVDLYFKLGTANKKGLGISVRKEMESEEIKDPGHVGHDLSVAILQARIKKEWKQSDLAKVSKILYL